jgi:hypothetical protein
LVLLGPRLVLRLLLLSNLLLGLLLQLLLLLLRLLVWQLISGVAVPKSGLFLRLWLGLRHLFFFFFFDLCIRVSILGCASSQVSI